MKILSEQSRIAEIIQIPELGEINEYLFLDKRKGPENDGFLNLKLEELKPVGWSPAGIIKGLEFLVSQVENGAQLYHVYDEETCRNDPDLKDITVVRLTPEQIDPQKPFVLLVAGGGFTAVSTVVEAYPAAADFVVAGYQAFVMTYRIGGFGQYPKPMDDVNAVMRFIYAHAEEFCIETKEYILNGFSAGGNLVCQFGTKKYGYEKYGLNRPAAILPIYGFLNIKKAVEHKNSEEEAIVQRMVGEHYTQDDLDRFDFVQYIDSDYPPCYMIHGLEDFLGWMENEKMLQKVLDKLNIPCMVREVPHAGHGFGDGSGTEAAGWVYEALEFVEHGRKHIFTAKQTLNEILSVESVKKHLGVVFGEEILDMIAPEYFDMPLDRVGRECIMPWGMPFPADDFLDSVNKIAELMDESIYDLEPLWQEKVQGYMPETKDHDHKQACLITKAGSIEKGTKKPAVIICPGGGYETLSMSMEGFAMADRMEEAGYKAFVCIYRVSPNRYPLPQEDLAMAVKFVRANAEQFGIDPENVMAMGSSAGGHVCAVLGYQYEAIDAAAMKDIQALFPEMAEKYRGISCKPDKICLNYPVISFMSEDHEPSFQALSGGDESLREALSVELHVEKSYPKTFVWACEDDELVPVSNAVRMAEALDNAGCNYESHIYPTGGHGCGLAYHTSAEEWSERLIEFMQ